MLLRALHSSPSLLFRPHANLIIYLRDHDKLITPRTSKINVSYANPTNLFPNAPVHSFVPYKLAPDMAELLDRQIFEQYKNKILRGIVDQPKIKQSDPLWGDEPVPIHYYNNISKIDLMSVSHPQNNDLQPTLRAIYDPYFQTSLQTPVTLQLIESSDLHQLVEVSLAARAQGVTDTTLWYGIQQGYNRGKKLYLLSSEELIKLKWAFDGLTKQGTPIFHQILAALLREDIPKMTKQQLVHLFYACRFASPGKTNLQPDLLDALPPHYRSFSFQEKTSFLLALTLGSKPIKHGKRVHKRRRYQFKQLAGSVLLQLDFQHLALTHQTVAQLVFSLAKLHLENTKFLSYPIRDYISQNLESYCADADRLYQAIVYLPQLQAGEGVLDQPFATRLRQLAVPRWSEFSKVQQIRMVHCFWNLGLMDDPLLQLYKGIQLEADSTLLYYAAQIELHTSSEREWQIVKCLVELQYLPLPYYVAYKRIYNYVKATTDWNLTPLTDKLLNLEYHYNAMRQYDSLLRVRTYRKLREFQKFADIHLAHLGNPIHNLELTHFATPLYQVSIDILSKRDFIPGTLLLKQTYLNKARSLKHLGWKHLTFSEEQLQAETLSSYINNIQKSHLRYVESQQAIIDQADAILAEKIQEDKTYYKMRSWNLEDINQLLSIVEDTEYIQLGEDGKDAFGRSDSEGSKFEDESSKRQ